MLTHRNIYLHALSVIAPGCTSRELAANTCCDSVVLHTIPLFHANGWGSAHTGRWSAARMSWFISSFPPTSFA